MSSKYEQIVEESKKMIVEQNKIIENCEKEIKKARLILDEHNCIVQQYNNMKKKTDDAMKNQENDLHKKRLMVANKMLTKDYVIDVIKNDKSMMRDYYTSIFKYCDHHFYEKSSCGCSSRSHSKKLTFDEMLLFLKNNCNFSFFLKYRSTANITFQCVFKYYESRGDMEESFSLYYEHDLTHKVLDS